MTMADTIRPVMAKHPNGITTADLAVACGYTMRDLRRALNNMDDVIDIDKVPAPRGQFMKVWVLSRPYVPPAPAPVKFIDPSIPRTRWAFTPEWRTV